MEHDLFRYFGVYTLAHLILAALQFFVFDWLIDFIGTGLWTHVKAHLVLLLVIDPLLIRCVLSRFLNDNDKQKGDR